jgi:hypothetical protein
MANREEFLIKVILDDSELKVKIPGLVKDTNNLSKAFENVTKSSKKYNKTAKQNKQVNDDMISSAGLAGATLTEFGRTISDLPFGITAITNNLSQLGTLFTTLVAKTGGTTKAFSLLGRQLAKGPLGIILIFQVLISLLQQFQKDIVGFFRGVEKANEATKKLRSNFYDLTEEIKENNKELRKQDKETQKALRRLERTAEILIRNRSSQRNANKSVEEFNKANQANINLLKQRTEIVKALGIEVDETRLLEEGYIQSLMSGAQTLEGVSAELNQRRIDLETQRIQGLSSDVELLEAELQLFIDTEEAKKVKEENYIKSEEYQVLVARIAKAKADAAKKALKENLEFESFLEVKEIAMSFEEAFAGYFDRFEEPLTVLEDFYDDGIDALLDYNRFRENFIERSELEILNIMEEQALARLLVLAQESEGLIDYETEKTFIMEFFAKKRGKIIEKEAERNRQELHDQIRELQQMLGQLQDVMNMMTDAELSREERKTVMLNNQLAERLKNEKLSAEERERINKQIEANEEKLQKKRDQIAERNFKLQKAFAVAQAAINTALAISDVLAREPGGLIKKGVAAAIIGALGAAQIAAILSTKFVPTASSIPSGQGSFAGGAAGGERQDPTFNIVGTGQQFQLSQAIAQRTGEPVRAYVVTGDVRSGLALERNIIKGSKLG